MTVAELAEKISCMPPITERELQIRLRVAQRVIRGVERLLAGVSGTMHLQADPQEPDVNRAIWSLSDARERLERSLEHRETDSTVT